MSQRAKFDDIATRIFNSFGDIPVHGQYLQKSFTYIPGGENQEVETPYPIRVIYLETTRETLQLYSDVDSAIFTLMGITSELPVDPDVKDGFSLNGENLVILNFNQDPASATTTFIVRVA